MVWIGGMSPSIDPACWIVHECVKVRDAGDGLCIQWIGLVHVNHVHMCVWDGIHCVDDLCVSLVFVMNGK